MFNNFLGNSQNYGEKSISDKQLSDMRKKYPSAQLSEASSIKRPGKEIHIDDPYPRNISAKQLSDMRKKYPSVRLY